MSKYKIPTYKKCTFIFNVLLFVMGLISGDQIIILSTVIIFVILSAEIEILEAIHKLDNKDKQ